MVSAEQDNERRSNESRCRVEEVEDEISEKIRNEALRTWNVGKQLGICAQSREEDVIKKLIEADGLINTRRAEVEENQTDVHP